MNAIITDTTIDIGDRGYLTVYINLDFGGSGQSFGDYVLYLPDSFEHSKGQPNIAGNFMYSVMKVVGVGQWKDLKGKAIRVRKKDYWDVVQEIGHIIKDEWYNPKEEFEKMKEKDN